MSNLYDKLEVSKKASKEVIDKAYHVLVKKYHPDLQKSINDKKIAEEKIKEINDAYEILGDENKRKIYDLKLEAELEEEKRKNDQEKLSLLEKMKAQENMMKQRQNEINNIRIKQENINTDKSNNTNYEFENMQKIQESVNRAYKDAYNNAYNNYLKKLGYKLKEPWTWKRFGNLMLTILIFFIIILAIWFFPPSHKIIVEFYEGNSLVKTIIDVIGNIFKGIGQGIIRFFQTFF